MKARKLILPLIAGVVIALGVSSQPAHAVTSSLWDEGVAPTIVTANDPTPVELGVKFKSSVAGKITGLKFYKGPQNTGVHTGSLWKGTTKLNSVTFQNETASGWQTALFATPVDIAADTTYVASYFAPNGYYSANNDYFWSDQVGGSLIALKSTASSGNGVYKYFGGYPNQTYRASNYWVDVIFDDGITPPQDASISSFTANPTSVVTGSVSTLAWAVAVGQSCSIDNGVGAVADNGSTSVTPAQTTTYTLTCQGLNGGSDASSAATVTVTSPTRPTNCAAVPSACGYPDATNTGPAAGTTFTRVPEDATSGAGWEWNATNEVVIVTAADTVLENLDVHGTISISVPNVTVRNSRVTACGASASGTTNDGYLIYVRYKPTRGYYASDTHIINNELNGSPVGCTYRVVSGVRDVYGMAPGMVISGNNIHGTSNGITAEYEALITDNWVHDLVGVVHENGIGDHMSGISNHGGANSVVIRHNTILLYGNPAPDNGGISGPLTIYSDFDHAQNVTQEDNLISGGSYTIRGGASGEAYSSSFPPTNIKIVNNRLVCGAWIYGPLAHFNPTSPGNEFTGNYCDQDLSIVTP